MICTFFGHRDVDDEVFPQIYSVLLKLIKNKYADTFYVGNNGNFDYYAERALRLLKEFHPHIKYYIVTAYEITSEKSCNQDLSNVIYPNKLRFVNQKYAITERNEWLIEKSDIVIAYVRHSYGGAAKFCNMAKNKGKKVIEL